MRTRSTFLLPLAALCLLLHVPARAQNYAFSLIADNSGRLSQFFGSPSINNAGTVAFYATLNGDAGAQGIFTGSGSGGPLTAITNLPASLPYINAPGTVAFVGRKGIVTGDGGPLSLAAAPADIVGGALAVVDIQLGGINSAGVVAFGARRFLGYQGHVPHYDQVVYVAAQGVVTPVAGGFSPSINDAGDVAFLGPDGSLRAGRGGAVATLAAPGGAFQWLSGPVINNAGKVAFLAGLNGLPFDAGGQGIFTHHAGVLTRIADTGGPFRGLQSPCLNAAGGVAFLAYLDTNGRRPGIFTGPDPARDRLIAAGDALFGSTVTSLGFGRPSYGLNDRGQVAFFAALADGRQVVVRADPHAPPRPGGVPAADF